MGEDDEVSDEDMDPSPTHSLDAVDPGIRYETKMVCLERWYYPHQMVNPDDEDPRIRRLRAGVQHPIEEVE